MKLSEHIQRLSYEYDDIDTFIDSQASIRDSFIIEYVLEGMGAMPGAAASTDELFDEEWDARKERAYLNYVSNLNL